MITFLLTFSKTERRNNFHSFSHLTFINSFINSSIHPSINSFNISFFNSFLLLHPQRFYKKAAAFVIRSVAKHSPQLAQAVVDSGATDALVVCLEEFDPPVKEAAAWAIGYIARHNAELAQAVVDAGAVPLLVLCVQEPELSLKRIAASALSDILDVF